MLTKLLLNVTSNSITTLDKREHSRFQKRILNVTTHPL